MKARSVVFMLILSIAVLTSCNPEDKHLRKLYQKDTRSHAISELIKMKKQIVNKEKTTTKLLNLNRTNDIIPAVLAVGEIGYAGAVPRMNEIADNCFKTQSVKNLKTLEALAKAYGMIGDASAVKTLERYFTIDTPKGYAPGQRTKPESVAKAAAVEALSKMPEQGRQHIPDILKLLDSDREEFGTKHLIAGVLGSFNDPKTVKPLVKSLFYEEQGYSLFSEARKSLVRLGKTAEGELLKAYNMQNASINKIADANKSRALKKMCPEYIGKDIEELKKKGGECLQHAQLMTTFASIEATTKIKTSMLLADIRSKKAVDTIITELEDQLKKEEKKPFLAEHLSVNLGKMGDFRATDTLLKMVSQEFALKKAEAKKGSGKDGLKSAKLARRGQEVSIRMKGAEALGILGDRKALPYLMKVVKGKDLSEQNVQNETIVFYEPKVWAADAFSRMVDNAEAADEFIAEAKAFVEKGKAYLAKVEEKTRKDVESRNKAKKLDKKSLEKQVKSQSRLDVNYESTKKAVTKMELYVKRAEVAKECKADAKCYASKLSDKEPSKAEKAVFMLGILGKMGEYKEQVKTAFYHKEPFVRDALTVAMLKTEDKGFVSILEGALDKEGDKVEYANSSKEFKAILSYLKSTK